MAQEDICFNEGDMKFNFRVSCIIENNGRFLLHKRKADFLEFSWRACKTWRIMKMP